MHSLRSRCAEIFEVRLKSEILVLGPEKTLKNLSGQKTWRLDRLACYLDRKQLAVGSSWLLYIFGVVIKIKTA